MSQRRVLFVVILSSFIQCLCQLHQYFEKIEVVPMRWISYLVSTKNNLITFVTLFGRWIYSAVTDYLT